MKDLETLQQTKEENLELTKRIWATLAQHDPGLFIESLAADCVWITDAFSPLPGEVRGKEAFSYWADRVYRTLLGFRWEAESFLASDRAVTVIAAGYGTGTNRFMGLPPISRPWRFRMCAIHIFNELGKISEYRLYYDRAMILGELGVIPRTSVFGLPPLPWTSEKTAHHARGGTLDRSAHRKTPHPANPTLSSLRWALKPIGRMIHLLELALADPQCSRLRGESRERFSNNLRARTRSCVSKPSPNQL